MRILEVTESFATGTMEVVRLVSEGMARAGHRVAIAYGERPETPLDLRATVDDEVELIPLPWTDRSVGAQVSSVRALRSLCRQWQPDVIHLHSSFAGFVGAISVTSCARPSTHPTATRCWRRDPGPRGRRTGPPSGSSRTA